MKENIVFTDLQWSFKREVKQTFLRELLDYNEDMEVEEARTYALASVSSRNCEIKACLTVYSSNLEWMDQEIVIKIPRLLGSVTLVDVLFRCHTLLYPFMTVYDYDSHFFEGIKVASHKNVLSLVLGS